MMGVVTVTEIRLSVWDRLRVLFGTSFRLRVYTETEHDPGKTSSESVVVLGQPPDPGGAVAYFPGR
jgi:hypothetical protein